MLSAREQVSAFLLDIDQWQRRLADFTLGLFMDFSFGEESTLVHQIILDSGNGLRVTLYHSIRIPDTDYVREASEFNVTATLAFSDSGCSVEALIEAHLEQPFGDTEPGVYTLYRSRDADLELDDALNALGRRVDEMCDIHDAPERLGFARST